MTSQSRSIHNKSRPEQTDMRASNIPVLLYTYRYFKLKVFFKGILNGPNFAQNNFIIIHKIFSCHDVT